MGLVLVFLQPFGGVFGRQRIQGFPVLWKLRVLFTDACNIRAPERFHCNSPRFRANFPGHYITGLFTDVAFRSGSCPQCAC